MKKIYLTISIDSKDQDLDHLKGIKRLNLEDVYKLKKIQFKQVGDFERLRVKTIVEYIEETVDDLLIGKSIKGKGQITEILKSINLEKNKLEKLFYDNGKRKKAAIEKYKEDYSLHSNWLDYQPEYVEYTYNQFEKTVNEILLEAKENNIQVKAI